MMLDRRTLLGAAAGAATLPLGIARAQDFPSQPLRMVVPFAAGGPTDIPARMIAEHMGSALPHRVVVENRTGSGVVVGTDVVSKAPKDGHTMLYTTVAHTVLRPLFPRLPFDPVADFAPVVLVGQIPCVLVVHNSVPARTVAEFVALLKANPGKYNFASSGNGGAVHLATALFLSMIGAEANHVPYRGSSAAYPDLINGTNHFMIDIGMSAARQPNMRALGISALERTPLAADLPTIHEQGVTGYEAYTWHMVMVPAGTPAAAIARLNAAVNAALAVPTIRERLGESQFMTIKGGTAEQAQAFLRSETEKWEGIVRRQNIRADG
jgi:tripartite-type tricarboxylate transporter receptor subunit TctC